MNKRSRALLIGCAVVTALCVLLLCTDFFGLRQSKAAPPASTPDSGALGSHYGESNEYKASEEWLAFISEYDPDGSILQSAVAEGGSDYAGDYMMYRVYSQELAEKLEDIVSRHGLILHKSMSFCYGGEELCQAAYVGSFLPENCECMGYIYDNGSFHYEGSALLGEETIAYQFDRQMKGVFSETVLNLPAQGESCRSIVADGVSVELCEGTERCLLHAELPLSYVTVTVPVGARSEENPNGIPGEWLEQLAGSFVWSQIG